MALNFKSITFFCLIVVFLSLAYSHNSQSKEVVFTHENAPLKSIISELFTNLSHDLIHGTARPNNTPTIQDKIPPPLLNASHFKRPDAQPLKMSKTQEIPPSIQNIIDYETFDLYDTNTLVQHEDYLYSGDEFNQYGINKHDILIHAPVTNITHQAIEVTPVTGQPPITIQVDTNTQIHDQHNTTSLLNLSDIIINNFVDVVAIKNDEENIIAIDITLSNDRTTQVQGTIDKDATPFSLKILNIEFIIDENTKIDTLFLVTQNESKPPQPTDYPTNAQFSNALIQYYNHVIQDPIQASITTQSLQSNIAQTIVIQ